MEKTLVLDEESYFKAMQALKQCDPISIDTETEEFSETRTMAFQLGLDGVGFACAGGLFYFPKRFVRIADFQELIDTKELIFHNAKFDLTILEKEGLDVSKARFHDTMLMSYLMNENRMNHKLKYLAESILKVPKEKIIEFRDVKPRPIKEEYGFFVDDYEPDALAWENELGLYCLDDCKYTLKLYEYFKPKMVEQDLMLVYEKVELPMVQVLRSMENRGIKIDKNYLIELGSHMETELVKIKAEIWKHAGREFDINSPKQLSVVLYQDKKYDVSDEFRTKTGAPSTGVGALDYLATQHPDDPLIGKILEYRELFKLHTAFVTSLLQKQKEGIVHPSFLQHGTVTGRLSCRDPNLQQIPRRSDEMDIRKAFIPREGFCFVISDLSQIELRIAAYFSKDPILVKAFQEGKDVHQETADAVDMIRFVNANVEESAKKKEARVLAKTVNFGLLYGRTPYGMHKGLGMTLEEAEDFIKIYFAKFKQFGIFMEQAKNTLKKHYAVKTLFRRRRRFPEYAQAVKEHDRKIMGRMERQATNSIVQGTAADIMKVQMRKIWEAIKPYNSHILVQIHDEIICEVPLEHAETVLEIVRFQMENAVKLGEVPVVTDPMIADRWKK